MTMLIKISNFEIFIKFARLNAFNITFNRIYETFNESLRQEPFTCEEQIMFSEMYAFLLHGDDEGESRKQDC